MTIRHLSALVAACLLAACSPKYNWREYTSPDGHYHVTFPGKPSTTTRTIDLDGLPVALTMTAVDVDGTTFAVGAAEAPDADRAQAAVAAMQRALVRNIGATVTREAVAATVVGSEARTRRDVEATGSTQGAPARLAGHFEARGRRFYQVIVLGRPQAMPAEQVEQFLSSFSVP